MDFESCGYSDRLLDKILLLNEQVEQKVDLNEVKKAIDYARKYHGEQKRQSGEPYYSHPLEVAYMVASYTALEVPRFFRTDMVVTAILHDTIEDTDLTFKMIEDIFGTLVANQVKDLTRVKIDRKISSEETINLLFMQEKYDVALIKIFDRVHNLQTLKAKSPEKAKKILEETATSFVTLAMVLNIPTIKQQIIQLCYEHLSISLPLPQTFFQDTFQPFSPISQNEIAQIQNLKLLVT